MCARRTSCGCMSTARTAALAAQSPHIARRDVGLGRADSLSLDPHKWLYAPLDAGCLLVRDPRALRDAFAEGADTSTWSPTATCPDFAFWDHGPELSRRFRALKIWFVLKLHGARAIRSDRREHRAAAAPGRHDRRKQRLRAAGAPPLSIVCFRYVPALRGRLG